MIKGNMERHNLDIDIPSIFRRLTKEIGYLILFAATMAMLYEMIFYIAVPTQFMTQTTLVVQPKESLNSMVRTNRASDTAVMFQEMLSTNLLQKKIASAMKMESLPGKISCELIPNTNMLILKVVSNSPRNAVLVMRGLLKYYARVMEPLIGKTSIQVLEDMKVPTQSITESERFQKMGMVFLGAMAVQIVLIAIWDMLKDDIKKEEDVEQKLDTNLLACIYYETPFYGVKNWRKKEKEIKLSIKDPIISFGFVETYQKIATRISFEMEEEKERVIVITSVEEREGTSTVARNILFTLEQRGKKVKLLDGRDEKPEEWKEKLKQGKEFDYIIIDTPAFQTSAIAEEWMNLADCGILVIKQNGASAGSINDVIDAFRSGDCRLLGCILNGVKTKVMEIGKHSYDTSYYKQYGGYGYEKRKKGYGYGTRSTKTRTGENRSTFGL